MRRISFSVMVLIYAVAAGGLLLLFGFGAFERFDLLLFDSNYSLRGEWQPSVRVVILAYDDSTNLWVNRNDLALRDVLADAVLAAAEAGARCVAVDYAFTRSTKHDEYLVEALLSCDSCVLACARGVAAVGGRAIPVFVDPTPDVAGVLEWEGVWAGVTNVKTDPDGVLRRLQMAWFGHPVVGERVLGGEWRLSFAAAALAASLNADLVEVGKKEVTITAKGKKVVIPRECMLDFCGPPGTLTRISVADLITTKKGEHLKDAVVFLGDVRSVAGDMYRTPASTQNEPWMAGVEFMANAFAALLERRWFVELPDYLRWLLFCGVLALCLPVFYLGRRRRIWTVAVWTPLIMALLWLAQFIAFLALAFVPVTGCMFAVLIQATGGLTWRLAFLWRRERQIVALFGRYVSRKVVRRIVEGEVRVDLAGHTKEISVLFADLHDFTPLSERLTAQQTGETLNRFFSRMIAVVFRHDGTLDKLMGDCVMAFFNDPDDQPDHAERACRVALEMVEAISGLEVDGRPLKVGVGINTGTATVGNLGTPQFYDYTAVGDTVNLANRLQGLTREYGVDVVVGEATYMAARNSFLFRRLDRVRVKGRVEPIEVFHLMAPLEKAGEDLRHLAATYEEALTALERGDSKHAANLLESLAERFPHDTPTRMMLKRCASR